MHGYTRVLAVIQKCLPTGLSDVQHRRTDRSVAKPFCQPDHSIRDLTIMVVLKIHKNDANYRRWKESHWIKALCLLTPDGLIINL